MNGLHTHTPHTDTPHTDRHTTHTHHTDTHHTHRLTHVFISYLKSSSYLSYHILYWYWCVVKMDFTSCKENPSL